MTDVTDFDLHGIVGIRLVGATAREAAAVTRQLGPIKAPLGREPDIVIRFQERLEFSTPIHYLGANDAGFTDDAFLVLQAKQKLPAKVQIPFDQIGGRCEIICEHGLTAVPHLIAIINLTMLAKGYLPLHASAFVYEGQGYLATGWAKGGKTEVLLAFMRQGAAYVGDEWVYLAPDGGGMLGIPEPIRVWQWHLDYLPDYRTLLTGKTSTRLKLLNWTVEAMGQSYLNGRQAKGRLTNRVKSLLVKQQYTHFPPFEFFGEENCPLSGPLDKVFFVLSHDSAEVTMRPIEPEEISRRMIFSLQEEQQGLEAFYRKFRFAFPDCRNPILENSAARQRQLLDAALAGKESYLLLHPYPAPIPELFEVMRPQVKDTARS
jgi:hypothetical protein